MTQQQLAAIQQALANLKQAMAGQMPAILSFNVNLNLTGDGVFSVNYQVPSSVQGKFNTFAYSGPLAELPPAQ